jgi:hypothetical protein
MVMYKMRTAGYKRCHMEGRKKERMWKEWRRRRSCEKTGIGGEARMLDGPHKFSLCWWKKVCRAF